MPSGRVAVRPTTCDQMTLPTTVTNSCPSGKRPCKHAIALAILVSSGHAFEARPVPSGLTSRASSSRYYGAGE